MLTKWDAIIDDVCLFRGLNRRDVISKFREDRISKARQEIMWRMAHELGLTRQKIGLILDRDRTTVLYGIRKHSALIGRVPEWVKPERMAVPRIKRKRAPAVPVSRYRPKSRNWEVLA